MQGVHDGKDCKKDCKCCSINASAPFLIGVLAVFVLIEVVNAQDKDTMARVRVRVWGGGGVGQGRGFGSGGGVFGQGLGFGGGSQICDKYVASRVQKGGGVDF